MNTGKGWPLWLAAGPIWATTSQRRPPRLPPPPRQLPPLLLREQPRQREHVVTGCHASIQQQDHGVVLEGAAVCCSSDCRRPALQPGLVYHQQRVLAGRLEGGECVRVDGGGLQALTVLFHQQLKKLVILEKHSIKGFFFWLYVYVLCRSPRISWN